MRIVADATTTMKHLYRVAVRRPMFIKRADVSEMDEIVLPRIAERCPELAVIRNGLWGYRL